MNRDDLARALLARQALPPDKGEPGAVGPQGEQGLPGQRGKGLVGPVGPVGPARSTVHVPAPL